MCEFRSSCRFSQTTLRHLRVVFLDTRENVGNTFSYAADVSRREQTTDPNFHKIVTNFEIIEFHYYFWNHHAHCIQISTNMPGIGSVSHEIDEFCRMNLTLNETYWPCTQC